MTEKEIPKHKCISCDKCFDQKSALTKHLNKKNPCNKDEKNIIKIKKRTCKYCDKTFTRVDTLKDHLMICKKKKQSDTVISEDVIEKLVDNSTKIEKQMNSMKQEMDKLLEKIKELESNQSSSIAVGGEKNTVMNGINTNNIQQNIHNNIKIVAYGKEDLSYITDDIYKILLNKGFKSVQNLVEYIHMNENKPENQNIHISNMRDNYVLIFDGIKWCLKERDDVMQEMIENKTDILTDKFEELIKTLDESTIKKFKRFLDEKDEDNVIDQIKKELKMILYNKKLISEPPKVLFNNANKEKIIFEHPKLPIKNEEKDDNPKDDIIITTYRKRKSTTK